MNTAEFLKDAKKLIADPKQWIQGAYAKDAEGTVVPSISPKATCWCSLGALTLTAKIDELNRGQSLRDEFHYVSAVKALRSAMVSFDLDIPIAVFNDNHSHDEVIALWDRAIAAEEAKL